MKFRDNYKDIPLHELVWVISKFNVSETPKVAIVVNGFGGERVITNGYPAKDYLFGDVIPVPSVELE